MAKTEKEKFAVPMVPHEANLVKKCAIAAEMTYVDFNSRVLSEKSFEYMNEIRELKGLPILLKSKLLKTKIPPKQDRRKTST